LDQPRVLEPFLQLLAGDVLEADLDSRVPGIVRAREVRVGVGVEEQLLLVAVDSDGEPAAVALARLPREALPVHAECDPASRRLLHPRERERDLPNRLPVGHAGDDSVGAAR